jgi:hypothetical protein
MKVHKEEMATRLMVLFPSSMFYALGDAAIKLSSHFQFGDTFWRQLIGTAMVANPAPTYANIAFGTHELQMLPYYKRYKNDVFDLWLKNPDSTMDDHLWLRFKRRLNGWHGLKWKISERTDTVVFLYFWISHFPCEIHRSIALCSKNP